MDKVNIELTLFKISVLVLRLKIDCLASGDCMTQFASLREISPINKVLNALFPGQSLRL